MRGFYKQQGVTTLLTSMVVLVLITLVVLYTTNAVLVEKKIVNSDARSKQAFEAAELGLNTAIAYLHDGFDHDRNGVLDPFVFDTNDDGVGDVGTRNDLDGNRSVTVTLSELPTDDSLILINSQGWSDDGSATRTISQIVGVVGALPGKVNMPMTARGNITVTGAATIFNTEGHSTLWSGDSIDLGSNAATATQVANMSDPNYPVCMETSRSESLANSCTTISSSSMTSIGLDAIENDADLNGVTPAEYFESVFKQPAEDYMTSDIPDDVISPGDANAVVQNAVGKVYWVQGNGLADDPAAADPFLNALTTTFSFNTTSGCEVNTYYCPQASLDPNVLIIDGHAVFGGNFTFYGLIFVTGNVTISGNVTVEGALVVGGNLANPVGGALTIFYDSNILARSLDNAGFAPVAGSWRDF